MNSVNGECKVISLNECRDTTNAFFKCLSLIDGWCIEENSNNCVSSIQKYFCKDNSTNFCKNISIEKDSCVSKNI